MSNLSLSFEGFSQGKKSQEAERGGKILSGVSMEKKKYR